jgi:hypothetical protein
VVEKSHDTALSILLLLTVARQPWVRILAHRPTTLKVHAAKVCMLREERKFILVAPQCKLRFSKAQLRSLRFKIFDATFMTSFGTKLWLAGLL